MPEIGPPSVIKGVDFVIFFEMFVSGEIVCGYEEVIDEEENECERAGKRHQGNVESHEITEDKLSKCLRMCFKRKDQVLHKPKDAWAKQSKRSTQKQEPPVVPKPHTGSERDAMVIVSEDADVAHRTVVGPGRSVDFACAAEFLPYANAVEQEISRNGESSGTGVVFRDDSGICESGEEHEEDGK